MEKKATQTACDSNQMSDFIEKGFKIVIINTFIELKESITKEVKGDIVAMSQQIENVNKDKEMIKKWNFWS